MVQLECKGDKARLYTYADTTCTDKVDSTYVDIETGTCQGNIQYTCSSWLPEAPMAVVTAVVVLAMGC